MSKAFPVPIKLGGQERDLKITTEAVRKIEAVIPWKDIAKIPEHMSIPESCIVPVLHYALEGGGNEKINMTKTGKWKDQFVEENGREALVMKIIYAIYASGIMGNNTKFKELLGSSFEDAEETEEDAKND